MKCPNCGCVFVKNRGLKAARRLMDGTLTATQISERTGVAATHIYRISAQEGLPIKYVHPKKYDYAALNCTLL